MKKARDWVRRVAPALRFGVQLVKYASWVATGAPLVLGEGQFTAALDSVTSALSVLEAEESETQEEEKDEEDKSLKNWLIQKYATKALNGALGVIKEAVEQDGGAITDPAQAAAATAHRRAIASAYRKLAAFIKSSDPGFPQNCELDEVEAPDGTMEWICKACQQQPDPRSSQRPSKCCGRLARPAKCCMVS